MADLGGEVELTLSKDGRKLEQTRITARELINGRSY
jgi:hypothetical protein